MFGQRLEIYDPALDTWTDSASSQTSASPNGRAYQLPGRFGVLVSYGGFSSYDPVADSLTLTCLPPASANFSAMYAPSPLPDGRVLFPADDRACSGCSLVYDPAGRTSG